MRNFNDLVRQAQELQKKLEEINNELETVRVEGVAQNIVRAVVNGKLEIVSIEILEEDLSKIDKEILQDLIFVAIREAQDKAKIVAQEKFRTLGALGGLLPNFPNGIN
uniref:Nucleoid-associated protein ENV82_04230 n=1 Tax=Caldisericum exile TaxID=693075 RepID=A0A7C4XU69_9BACT